MTTEEPNVIVEDVLFWFVWTKNGRAPRYTHSTYGGACTEAQRLAKLHPDRKFIVLEAKAKFHVPTEAE